MACKDSGMLDEMLNRPTGELWLFGSDGNDDDDSGRDDDDSTDEDDEDDEDADGDDKSAKSKKSAKAPTAAEIAAMQRRIANFDEERDRDKAKIKKLGEDKTALNAEIARLKSEGVKDEDVKKANDQLTSANARLQAQVHDLLIKNAFLGDKTRQWVDPSAAAKLLDTSNVEIDDSGRVTGLSAAIDELADKSKYLLVQAKSSSKDDDTDGGDDQQQRQQRKTGDQPGNTRKNGTRSQQARDDRLRQRFPGLRTR